MAAHFYMLSTRIELTFDSIIFQKNGIFLNLIDTCKFITTIFIKQKILIELGELKLNLDILPIVI